MKKYINFGKGACILVTALFLFSTITGNMIEIVNADPPQYVDVQVMKWTSSEIVISNESWLESSLADFQDDIDAAYNSSLNTTRVMEELVEVYIEYGVIPQGKTLSDLLTFLEVQYEENETEIEDFYDDFEINPQNNFVNCHVDGNPYDGYLSVIVYWLIAFM